LLKCRYSTTFYRVSNMSFELLIAMADLLVMADI